MRISIRTPDWSSLADSVHLGAAAELVYESFPEFYDTLSHDHEAIRNNIIRQLRDSDSELGDSVILTIGESMAGISIHYASDEMKARQLVSLRHLIAVSNPRPNMLDGLRSFKELVERIELPRYAYWARLGVRTEFRRLAVASMISSAMEYDSRSRHFEYICAHVNRDNGASMKMQTGRGFQRISEAGSQFVALAKRIR